MSRPICGTQGLWINKRGYQIYLVVETNLGLCTDLQIRGRRVCASVNAQKYYIRIEEEKSEAHEEQNRESEDGLIAVEGVSERLVVTVLDLHPSHSADEVTERESEEKIGNLQPKTEIYRQKYIPEASFSV